MTVLLPDGDSLIPTFENDPDYIELDRAPTGQRVFERRTGGRMKRITVTLLEGVPPDDTEIIALMDWHYPFLLPCETNWHLLYSILNPMVDDFLDLSSETREKRYAGRTDDVTAYIVLDDLKAAVEAALKEGE